MIVNGSALLNARPLEPMLRDKHYANGVSHGLSEAGYDIRIKQEVRFLRQLFPSGWHRMVYVDGENAGGGRFALASAVEEFDMPDNLVGIVHDKSTWARQGLSVFNTVIEPGWRGFLTLELVYHGEGDLVIPAGSGIAQVIFTRTATRALYDGRYQNQPDQPTPAIEAKP